MSEQEWQSVLSQATKYPSSLKPLPYQEVESISPTLNLDGLMIPSISTV
jgi:hypothetical protein